MLGSQYVFIVGSLPLLRDIYWSSYWCGGIERGTHCSDRILFVKHKGIKRHSIVQISAAIEGANKGEFKNHPSLLPSVSDVDETTGSEAFEMQPLTASSNA